MIWASTKELYAMFLESDWWRNLSTKKKRRVGKCEQCGTKKHLTSHHIRYPENWFDTKQEDLKVLCWPCHRATHINRADHLSKKRKQSLRKKLVKPLRPVEEWSAMKELKRARSCGRITRQEFKARKAEMRAERKEENRQRRMKQRPKPTYGEYDPKSPWHVGMYEGITPQQAVDQIGILRAACVTR